MLNNENFGIALLDKAAKREQAIEPVSIVAEEIPNMNQFDFEVIEKPVFLHDGIFIPGHKALVRSDNETVLNVCKSSYGLITNAQFCEIVFKLAEITGYEISGFHEFAGGCKVLAFLKAPETSLNGWQFSNYMAFGNSHDSTKAFFVALTQVMIRCQNQFTSLAKGSMKAYHTSGVDYQLKNIRQSISLYQQQQNIVSSNYQAMLKTTRSESDIARFVGYLFDVDPKADPDTISTRKLNQMRDFLIALKMELNDVGVNDFGLFCAVTRYTTHVRNQKDKTFGNVFGSNAELNNKALRYFDYLN